MLLFGTTNGGANGNDDIMNDFVIVPPKPDAMMGQFDEYSYSNLYDCYTDYTYNHTSSPDPNHRDNINGASAGATAIAPSPSPSFVDTAASATGVALSTASGQSPSFVSHSSSLLSSNSYSDECLGNIADGNLPTSSKNNDENNNISMATTTKATNSASVITRDPRNGAFTFQVHAEYDLLLHVKKDLFLLDNQRDSDCIRLSEHIMHSIDEYCLKKQWMYHIGYEKGIAVSRFMRSRLERWYKENVTNICNSATGCAEDKKIPKFICVELGTYCGYSSLVVAVTLHQFLRELQQQQLSHRLSSLSLSSDEHRYEKQSTDVGTALPPPFEFHIFTTEISSKLLNVAQSMLRLANMEDCVTPILVKEDYDSTNNENDNAISITTKKITESSHDDNKGIDENVIHDDELINDHELKQERKESSVEFLSRTLKQQHGVSKIDFLLLDHAKHLYLHDLQTLERCGLVGKGSYVSADNVVFNRLDTYREHMRQLELIGVVDTRLEEMCLEYSNNLKDGIEMTVYLKDSPMSWNRNR